jgi:uncharacterized protein (DUF2164 family)
MTPKEKAQELVDKMYHYQWREKQRAKECALIAVEFSKEFITGDLSESFDKFLYIQEIKEEIEKL